MVNDMSLAAQAKFQQILANKFAQKLAAGIDLVVEQLTVEGGFLDDPLVRILLPPPVGLVIDVARDFNDNPQAALLETLMNRAAENAIPVAGPILKTVLANMNADTLQTLVNSPRSAATDVLIAEGGEEVQQALLPLVTQSLTENGAIKIYSDLMQVYSNIDAAENAVANSNEQAVVESVSPDALGEYVVKQAVGGLFKKVAAKELAVRESLDDMVNIVPL
ncbi:hypothetical protein C0068_02735 [Zhongshania marina]|jgi:hypothetical protein|uniref:DUF4197 domain-containing protein n=2 Tax=Zhongshania marina TaxID=2304603 RepID=A0A2S4HKH1_9GAMM|nr:hypothetical protein C0068_02735 [Marortus luteolus]